MGVGTNLSNILHTSILSLVSCTQLSTIIGSNLFKASSLVSFKVLETADFVFSISLPDFTFFFPFSFVSHGVVGKLMGLVEIMEVEGACLSF